MNNNNNFKNFFKKNGFSVAICSTIAIMLVASLYFSYNSLSQNDNIAKADQNLEVNKSDVKSYKETETITEATTDLKKSEIKEDNTIKKENVTTTEKTSEIQTNTKTSENTENKTFSLFDETKEMSWPVSGKIIMDYSTETAIYDKTLDMYRTNNSICISSPEGTDVLSSAEGIVENIFLDNENGNTVVINHGNGWLSTYGQLDENINVSIGQVVEEREKIGKIGLPTNYAVLLGPHLDFKITKDEIFSDPKLVLAQLEE